VSGMVAEAEPGFGVGGGVERFDGHDYWGVGVLGSGAVRMESTWT
jgi:hypothetical protein